ncbi:MAG: hypothetical protein EU549_03625 [Promethearchaeota archaeon]|nr:MAG: hypothetical protein EU549_03625 [Candidatus Lokiarchaeota archaeon]
MHCYLVPKSFLLRQNYIEFRENFLKRANLLKIFDLGSNIFKSATNEVIILIFENKKNNLNRDLFIYDFPKNLTNIYKNQEFDNLKRCINQECQLINRAKNFYPYSYSNTCIFCNKPNESLNRIRIKPTSRILKIIEKMEKKADLNYLNVKDFPKMIRGEEAEGLKLLRKFIKENTQNSCFFLNAKKDITYYHFTKRKSFNIKNISPKVLKGSNYEYYLRPKLIIKHNKIVPETVFTIECTSFTSSVYSLLHDKDSELKYLCGCLNSLPIQFYCTFGINNQKDTTINLNQYMIRHLPIPRLENKEKLIIAKLVDEIIADLKKSNIQLKNMVKENLSKIDNFFMNFFEIEEEDKNFMKNEIGDRIDWFKKIYK